MTGLHVFEREESYPLWLNSRWQCRQNRKLSCLVEQIFQARQTHTYTTYIQYPLNTIIIFRGGALAECENCRLSLHQRWLEKGSTATWTRSCLYSLQWKVRADPSTDARVSHKSWNVTLVTLRTASWHHPGTMDTLLGISPMWCRSCKVGVKCLLTLLHLGLQHF